MEEARLCTRGTTKHRKGSSEGLGSENISLQNIQLDIVTCPTCPEKFIRDKVVAPCVPTPVVTVNKQLRSERTIELKHKNRWASKSGNRLEPWDQFDRQKQTTVEKVAKMVSF